MTIRKDQKKTRGSGDTLLLLLSAIGFLIVVYFLFLDPSDSGYRGQAVGVLKTDARVRRRHARSLSWTDIGGGSELYRKDIIYTPPGVAQAFISFGDQKKIQLEPDSMIQLDDVSREQLQITIFAGRVKGDVKVKAKPVFRWVPYPRPRTTALRGIASPDFLELLASEWEQRVREVLARPAARIAMKKIASLPPPLSQVDDYVLDLVEPKDQRYNLSTNRWLGMKWSKLPWDDVEYELDVARDEMFSKTLTYRTRNNHISVQLVESGTYYWRVRATRGKRMIGSAKSRFTMSEKGGVSSFGGRLPASGGPSGYNVDVAKNAAFSPVLGTQVVGRPQCPTKGLAPGTYFCRVTRVGGEGKPKIYTFEVK